MSQTAADTANAVSDEKVQQQELEKKEENTIPESKETIANKNGSQDEGQNKEKENISVPNNDEGEPDNKEIDQQEDQETEDLGEIEESAKSLEKALEHKERGNSYFKEQLYDDAIECYDLALKYCPSTELKQLSIFNSNLAICFLKKEDYDSVIEYTTESIKQDPTFKKPLMSRVIAYEKKEQLEDALEDLKELEKIDPNDKELKVRIAKMTIDLEKLNEKRKTEVISGLKTFGETLLNKVGLSLNNFKLGQNENGSYNIQFQK